MKYLIAVVLSFFGVLTISAQGIKVQYVAEIKASNVVNIETYFFDNQQAFLHYGGTPVREAVKEVKNEKGELSFEVLLDPDAVESAVAYVDYRTKRWIARVPLQDEFFKVTDDIPVLAWMLTGQQKVIAGHPCQAATTHFKGRDYTAWFATDIAINAGPYKFSGLPGLILEVTSDDGLFSWYCKSIGRTTDAENKLIVAPEAKRSVVYAEFMALQQEQFKRYIERLGTAEGITVEGDYTINLDTYIELPE